MASPIVLSSDELKGFSIKNNPLISKVSARAWLEGSLKSLDDQLNVALRVWLISIYRDLADEYNELGILKHCLGGATFIPKAGEWSRFFEKCNPPVAPNQHVINALEFLMTSPLPDIGKAFEGLSRINNQSDIFSTWPPKPIAQKAKNSFLDPAGYMDVDGRLYPASTNKQRETNFDSKPQRKTINTRSESVTRSSAAAKNIRKGGSLEQVPYRTAQLELPSIEVTSKDVELENQKLVENTKKLIELQELRKQNTAVCAELERLSTLTDRRLEMLMMDRANIPHYLSSESCNAILNQNPDLFKITNLEAFATAATTHVHNWALELILGSELYDSSQMAVRPATNPMKAIEDKLDHMSQLPDDIVSKLEYLIKQQGLITRKLVSTGPAPMSENVLLPNDPSGELDSNIIPSSSGGQQPISTAGGPAQAQIKIGDTVLVVSKDSLAYKRYLRSQTGISAT